MRVESIEPWFAENNVYSFDVSGNKFTGEARTVVRKEVSASEGNVGLHAVFSSLNSSVGQANMHTSLQRLQWFRGGLST